MKTVERHKKTDFGDVWYVNAVDGTYRFAVYKYDDDDETIYLSNVFVKEDSRRQGYGNEILTSAEDYAKRLNASVICLKVLSGSDVHRWYKRHGYEDLEKDEEERGYMWMKKELKKVNESIWRNISQRSEGIRSRKEDNVNRLDYVGFYNYLVDKYKDKVEYIDYRDSANSGSSHVIVEVVNGLELSINYYDNEIFNILINCDEGVSFDPTSISVDIQVKKLHTHVYHVTEKNGDAFNKTFLKILDFFIHNIDVIEISESIWRNISQRSEGISSRAEDSILTDDERINLNSYLKRCSLKIVYLDRYEKSLNGFVEYMKNYKKGFSTSRINDMDELLNSLDRIIAYAKKNWSELKSTFEENINNEEKKIEKTGFKKIQGESIVDTLKRWWESRSYEYKNDVLDWINNDLDSHEKYSDPDDAWDDLDYLAQIDCYMDDPFKTNECEGVPGGLTPVDVGGMGAAYFPGPNGEPGSGDLPMPTGRVYQQVAPFSGFIKMKKSKKKKKKFRKEDEPCSHSPNAKVYDYVDDYREYVDRTYNNVDKRK